MYVRTVCTGGHRFTREFVVGVVAAVEIHVRACIMCRPWTQICRLFVGSATIINIIHKSTCVRVCVCLCVKTLIKITKHSKVLKSFCNFMYCTTLLTKVDNILAIGPCPRFVTWKMGAITAFHVTSRDLPTE